MASLRVLIGGLAGMALWSALLLMAADKLRQEGLAHDDTASAEPAEMVAPRPPVLETRAVRAIDAERFASPFAGDGIGLERLAARDPMAGDDVRPAEPVRLARPQTIEAGQIAFGARTLRLAGVAPTDRNLTCPSSAGGNWPCGMVARTQQRLFLRNRTIACDMPDDRWHGVRVANCHIGGTDIAWWLAQNGWVAAEAGSPLAGVTTAARAARRGIFGDDPR